MRLSGGWWVALGVVALVLAVSWMTVEVRSGTGLVELDPAYSTWSSAPGGTRGLFLALAEAGPGPERVGVDWTRIPPELGILVVPPPRRPPSEEEWAALTRWVRFGGTLVFCPPRQDSQEGPGVEPAWRSLPVGRVGGNRRGGERVAVYLRRELREEPALAKPLWAGQVSLLRTPDRTVATTGRLDLGRVVVLQSPEILSNSGILREDNLRVALGMLEGEGRIGFDEFHLGYESHQVGLWELSPPVVRAGLVHLAAALLLLVFALSRRVGGPRLERARSRQRSEYLESMAGLLRRARATRLVVRLRRHALEATLCRALHLPPGSPATDQVASLEALSPGLGRSLEELLGAMEHLSSGERPAPEDVLELVGREKQLLEKVRNPR